MDEQILERIAAGEHDALGELAQRYEAQLLGLARGLLGGSPTAAEDAVQEAWVRVLRGAGGFRGEAGVKTWLYRIVINRCRDIQRRERRRIVRETSFRLVGAGGAASETDVSGDAAERDRRLHASLRGLPVEQREAVLLCHHRGVTQAEAARVLGIPEGTLKSRVRTGLAALRKRLGDGASRGEKPSALKGHG